MRVSPEKKHLEKIRKQVTATVPAPHITKVHYCDIEELKALICELTAQSLSTETTVSGYKVKNKVKPQILKQDDYKKQMLAQWLHPKHATGSRKPKQNP
jgi:hypothetical protein